MTREGKHVDEATQRGRGLCHHLGLRGSPVFFDDIHKVGISFLADVLEPQREEGGLVQAHACPPSLLLQDLTQGGLAVGELLLWRRAQEPVLGFGARASRSLPQDKEEGAQGVKRQGHMPLLTRPLACWGPTQHSTSSPALFPRKPCFGTGHVWVLGSQKK